jgi:hypothetical protein
MYPGFGDPDFSVVAINQDSFFGFMQKVDFCPDFSFVQVR